MPAHVNQIVGVNQQSNQVGTIAALAYVLHVRAVDTARKESGVSLKLTYKKQTYQIREMESQLTT